MATVEELTLRINTDFKTQSLSAGVVEMKKLAENSASADTAVQKLSLSGERIQRSMNNARDSMLKMQLATTGLNSALGGVPSEILAVSNQVENFEFAALRAGKEINLFSATVGKAKDSIGLLGTASLVVGAAMAGWKIGRVIADFFGLDAIIQKNIGTLLDWKRTLEGTGLDQLNTDSEAVRKAMVKVGDGFRGVQIEATKTEKTITDGNSHITKSYAPIIQKVDEYAEKLKKLSEIQFEDLKRHAADEWRIRQKAAQDILNADEALEKERLQAEDNFTNAVLEAVLKRKENEEAAIKEIAEYERQQLHERLSNYAQFFSQIGSMLGGVGGGGLSAIGSGIGAFEQILGKVESGTLDFFGNTLTKANAWAGGIGAAFASAAQSIGGSAGTIMNAIGSIATGFATGGWVGAVIAGIGVATNALMKFFQHDWTGAARKMAASIGFAISDELAKQIGELGKQIGDVATATTLSISAIADEIGITADNVEKFIASTRDLFVGLSIGMISAQQATEVLNDMFPRLAEVAIDELGLISDSLVELITLAQQFGLEIASMTEFIQAQLGDAADAINDIVTNSRLARLPETGMIGGFGGTLPGGTNIGPTVPPSTIREFQDMKQIVLEAFNKMIASGMNVQEAVEALGPSFDVLSDAAEHLGLTLDPAFQSLLELSQLDTRNLTDVNTLLRAFANTGGMTKDTFKSLENQFEHTLHKFMKDGKLSNAELMAMAPTLALLAELSEKYGFALDKQTQKAIDAAREQGILADKQVDPMVTLSEILNDRLIPLLEQISDIFGGMGADIEHVGQEFNDATRDATAFGDAIGAIPLVAGGGGFTGTTPLVQSFQGLSEPFYVPHDNFLAKLHAGETIMPKTSSSTAVSNNYYITVTGYTESTVIKKINDAIRNREIGKF